jgi:DNA helicase-2/ATP-dependent DNA helicase PcrA
MDETSYNEGYNKLNAAQREAVDTIDGPVMVVAGPGTGKTQVLALRIANILKKTDTKADAVLCLTFTNSGVRAMRDRLEHYIGNTAHDVVIRTFHSFAIDLVERHYELLDYAVMPSLLSDDEAVFLVDQILHENEWGHIRPRTNPSMYFGDLKQLISILKRERISAEAFLYEVEADIKSLQNDPESISTRGESKGKMKKEVEKKIESLERTSEVVEFYRLYEDKKRTMSRMDYDDVLEYSVRLAEEYEDVSADIRENYLYVLVDEHQDSSGVQNSFLKAVWKETELPNIFVVGDDRQLIYGFSGASLSYFTEFSNLFGKAKLIPLTENYRSTTNILALADELLQSSMTVGKLSSNIEGDDTIHLSEYTYPRDEIIAAGLYFKHQIEGGVDPRQCALLVPRNYHVRDALATLSSLGVPVSYGANVSLFSTRQTEVLRRVLGIIAAPYDAKLLAESVLDRESGISPLVGHGFLRQTKVDRLTIDELVNYGRGDTLFSGESPVAKWGSKLKGWVDALSHEKLSLLVSSLGNELLVDSSANNDELLENVEVVRSFIHLATLFQENNKKPTLTAFLDYIDRLESYGAHIELAHFASEAGVQVMTLQKSKGMEYTCVWVAHMNEEVLMSEKKNGFTLPEKIKEHVNERTIEMAKRELYVAITRAKQSCTISYASKAYTGTGLSLAHIIRDLDPKHFDIHDATATEQELLAQGPELYTRTIVRPSTNTIEDLKQLVVDNYADTKVSVTMLNNFFECPRKWYFRNFLRLPEVKGVSLALGSAVHSTIEYILKAGSLPTDIHIQEKIYLELEKEGVVEGAVFKKLAKDAISAVKHWLSSYYVHLSTDFTSERSLQFRDPLYSHLLMYGKIDLTERTSDGTITITDFKTGSSKTPGMIEKLGEDGRMSDLLRQLAMYSYLVSGAEKGKVVARSRLLFLESKSTDKNSLYEAHIDEEKRDLLIRDIKEYDEALKTGSWVDRECHYKSYGGTDTCEYCARAERVYKIQSLEKNSNKI